MEFNDTYMYGGFEVQHYGSIGCYKATVHRTLKLRGKRKRSTCVANFEHATDPNVALIQAQAWIDGFNTNTSTSKGVTNDG